MNLFELFVKIGVDDQASSKLSELSGKLGNGLKTAAKIGTAAVGAAATAIVGLTKSAVENYAEYEQLVGGVETLFDGSKKTFDEFAKSIGTSWSDIAKYQKEAGLAITGTLDPATLESLQSKYEAMSNAHNIVLENAANAYKTAGLSANEYMSTVTSFSASLIQSLGGDTAAAAEYADRAIVSMSDNANKMGTSIDMIQNAYQGFAKQNYTMLDNLKLGYGGTQTEMQRLIEDASKMTDVQERLGIKVDESSMSFSNIVNAIQVVQENMGIAGATALEAGTTIEGSVNSMKAAWQNLLTGISDGNADVGKLMDNLVTTIVGDGTENNLGVIGNVLPAIETALGGIAKLIEGAAPKIIEILPGLVERIVPSVISAATGMVNAVTKVLPDLLNTVVDAIIGNAPALIDSAIVLIGELSNGILSQLPQIVKLGLDLIVSLANGIAQAIPNLIPTIVSVVLEIVNTLTNPDTLSNLINASVEIILALANGLIEAIPDLVDSIPVIVESLITAILNNLDLIIEAAIQITLAILQGIISAIPQLVSAAIQIITFLAQSITNPENVQKIIDTAGKLINSLIEGFNNVLDSLIDVGEDVVKQIRKGISDAWDGLKKWFNDLWDSLFGKRSVDVDIDVGHSPDSESQRIIGTFGRPYDSYYDLAHNRERFLTAVKSNQRNGGSVANTSGVTIIQNIHSVPQTPVELAAATSAYFEQARWAF